MTKRCKAMDETQQADNTMKPKVECAVTIAEDCDKKNGKKEDTKSKTAEPPKDYIHVRARRGQATDSHSLAERVHFLLHYLLLFTSGGTIFALEF